MRAALRHQLQVRGERPMLHVGDFDVDLRGSPSWGTEVKLSPKEYDLLRLLVQHAGKVLTHRFLLQELWMSRPIHRILRVTCGNCARESTPTLNTRGCSS